MEEACRHKDWVGIGEERWRWCLAFNARVEDLDCEGCDYTGLEEVCTWVGGRPRQLTLEERLFEKARQARRI